MDEPYDEPSDNPYTIGEASLKPPTTAERDEHVLPMPKDPDITTGIAKSMSLHQFNEANTP